MSVYVFIYRAPCRARQGCLWAWGWRERGDGEGNNTYIDMDISIYIAPCRAHRGCLWAWGGELCKYRSEFGYIYIWRHAAYAEVACGRWGGGARGWRGELYLSIYIYTLCIYTYI